MQIEAHAPRPPMGSAVECVGPAAPFGPVAASVGVPQLAQVDWGDREQPPCLRSSPASEAAVPGAVDSSTVLATAPAMNVEAHSPFPYHHMPMAEGAVQGPGPLPVDPATVTLVGSRRAGGKIHTCKVLSWNVARDVKKLDAMTKAVGAARIAELSLVLLSEVTISSERVTAGELGKWSPNTSVFMQTVKCGKVMRGLVAIAQRSLGPILVDSGANDHFQWMIVELAALQPRTVRVRVECTGHPREEQLHLLRTFLCFGSCSTATQWTSL